MTALTDLLAAFDSLEGQEQGVKDDITDKLDAYTIAQALGIGGVTASAAEVNVLDSVTPGTAAASKAAVLGANKELNEFHTAALYIGAAAGTLVTATAAEINGLAAITPGTAVASKVAVLGATKNLDVLGLPVGGLKIGAGGAEVVVTPTAAELNVLSGIAAGLTAAELSKLDGVTATTAELNLNDGIPAAVVITHASTGGANTCTFTITVNDAAAAPVAYPVFVDFWLSDAATGLAITSHPADTIVATTGTIWHVNTAACSVRVQTNASGVAVVVVTDTHKTAYYPCTALGLNGYPMVHPVLIGGDYGA